MEEVVHDNWGLPLNQLYKLALKFYKDKEGKAIQLSYQEKCQLTAYVQQASHGKYVPEKHGVAGVLDVVGRNRQAAWLGLGDMSSELAMSSFVDLLSARCAIFHPYIAAYIADQKEQERIRLEEEERIRQEEVMREMEEKLRDEQEKERERQEEKKRQIHEALNKQTYDQFKVYAEQHCPGNLEQQAVLIKQLQEYHYHQYMSHLLSQSTKVTEEAEISVIPPKRDISLEEGSRAESVNYNLDEEPVDSQEEDSLNPNGQLDSPLPEGLPMQEILPASMWTRKDIKEFKDSIAKEEKESVIKVGHGEIVTVRVPTHEEGTCLFWEFATDSYDIGFGVFFEWTPPTEEPNVSIHVSDGEDDESETEENSDPNDVESGGKVKPVDNKVPTSVIVPIYRRDCHEEVYAGSHVYPSQGVYLLKFDNSYSLWRSKTLYYRVYYTK